MKMNKRNIICILAASAALLSIACGCQGDEVNVLPASGTNLVGFNLDWTGATKASPAASEVELPRDTTCLLMRADGKDTLIMMRTASLTSFGGEKTEGYALTKAAPVTTANLKERYGDKIYMSAYNGAGVVFKDLSNMQLVPVTGKDDSTHHIWRTVKDYLWPDYAMQFWAWAPNGTSAGQISPAIVPDKSDGTGSLTFSYETPKSADGKDAEAQSDVLVAKVVTSGQPADGYAPLTFLHALSAVRFVVVGSTIDFTVKSISLTGVYAKGSCTYIPTDAGETAAEQVTWSVLSDKQIYTQTFSGDHGFSPASGEQVGGESATFMLIPQCNGNDNVIKFDMTIEQGGEESHYKATLKDQEWLPGVTYTYCISSIDGDVKIRVDEEFDTKTKKNVTVTNIGDRHAYIRVAVTANWIGAGNCIEQACDWITSEMPEGKGWGAEGNWVLHDGYFYYKYGIQPEATTRIPLFTSYTTPVPPAEGWMLDMMIMAQSVLFDTNSAIAKQCWGNDITFLTGELEEKQSN